MILSTLRWWVDRGCTNAAMTASPMLQHGGVQHPSLWPCLSMVHIARLRLVLLVRGPSRVLHLVEAHVGPQLTAVDGEVFRPQRWRQASRGIPLLCSTKGSAASYIWAERYWKSG